MKKILLSVSIIAAVAAVVFGITTAFFSDTETSTGNTFTAGSLDLKVDSECTYNGMTCDSGYWTGHNGDLEYACSCLFGEKDLGAGDLFFHFTDIKPGDSGEDTISLHAVDNDAHVCGYVLNLANADNDCTEPEEDDDLTCDNPGAGQGELQDYINVTIWRDGDCENDLDGICVGEEEERCEAITDPTTCGQSECEWVGDEVLVNNVAIDSNSGGWYLGQLKESQKTCLGLSWNVPDTVGNVIQTDSVTGDIYFYVEQVRHNDTFSCPKPTRYSNTLVFGPGGWAGWSCPAGTHAIGGGISSPANPTVLASHTANYGEVYPHWTFNHYPGESGWVVQNDNDQETITYYVDCF